MSSSALRKGLLKRLSSETFLDDEDCMDFTLSQTRRRMTAIGLATTLVILGCDGSMKSDRNADSRGAANRTAASSEAKSGGTFAWPEDPSHPMLVVDIESEPGRGTITIELMPELAPKTVAHVIELAEQGYYDGTTFHRVIPGFMIQGGDPNSRDRDPDNDGQGNSELSVDDEFGAAPFVRGVVGMGNKGRRNSTGGQFFIMHADNRNLDGRYTVIGRVVDGMDVVDAITTVSIDRIGRWGPKDRPIKNVVMTSVAIETRETAEAHRNSENDPQHGGNTESLSDHSLADL